MKGPREMDLLHPSVVLGLLGVLAALVGALYGLTTRRQDKTDNKVDALSSAVQMQAVAIAAIQASCSACQKAVADSLHNVKGEIGLLHEKVDDLKDAVHRVELSVAGGGNHGK